MAIKPTVSIIVRASDDNYTTGPAALIGTPTKVPAPAPETAEGWKADQKPPAQWFNNYDNPRDLYTKWVEEGTWDHLTTAHIKEADSSGLTKFSASEHGNTASDNESLTVRPNNGTNETGLYALVAYSKPAGIFESINSDVSALVVRGTDGTDGVVGILRVESPEFGPRAFHVEAQQFSATKYAARINQTGSSTGLYVTGGNASEAQIENGSPALIAVGGTDDSSKNGGFAAQFLGQSGDITSRIVDVRMLTGSTSGAGIYVTTAGFMTGIIVEDGSGRDTCMRLISKDSGGADKSAPLILQPQTHTLSGSAVDDGAIWIQEDDAGGQSQFRPRLHGGESLDIPILRNHFCYIDEYSNNFLAGPTDDTFFDIIANKAFDGPMIPIGSTTVIIKIWMQIRRSSTGADGTTARVELVDSIDGVVKLWTPEFDAASAGTSDNTIYKGFFFHVEHPIAAGQRSFTVRAARESGTTGGITVREWRMEVRAKA